MLENPRIIVATDFSEGSDHAVRAGELLRKRLQGSLEIVHVAIVPLDLEWMTTEANAAPLPRTYHDELMEDLRRRLSDQIKRCDVKAETRLLSGTNHRDLENYIQEKKADVLVVGHKGEGKSGYFIGSFTTKLISSNEIPLLVVNRPMEIGKIAGLIEAEYPVPEIFKVAEELSSQFSAKVEYISVKTESGTESQDLESSMRRYMRPDAEAGFREEVLTDESISHALPRILGEEGIDLAILCRSRKSLIEKIFLKSVSRQVLENYSGNFLLLPPSEKEN